MERSKEDSRDRKAEGMEEGAGKVGERKKGKRVRTKKERKEGIEGKREIGKKKKNRE